MLLPRLSFILFRFSFIFMLFIPILPTFLTFESFIRFPSFISLKLFASFIPLELFTLLLIDVIGIAPCCDLVTLSNLGMTFARPPTGRELTCVSIISRELSVLPRCLCPCFVFPFFSRLFVLLLRLSLVLLFLPLLPLLPLILLFLRPLSPSNVSPCISKV